MTLLTLLLAPLALAAGPALDEIYTVDYRFFLEAPRLPWARDAFRRPAGRVTMPEGEAKPVLQGIARGPGGASAVIDGNLVKVGDHVGERRLVEIGANYVLLEKKSSLVELVLPPAARTPASSTPAPKEKP